MGIAAEDEFAHADQHLCRTEKCTDRNRSPCIDTATFEQRNEIGGEPRRNECIERVRRNEREKDKAPGQEYGSRGHGLIGGWQCMRIELLARQGEQEKRRGYNRQHGSVDEVRAAPADRIEQK